VPAPRFALSRPYDDRYPIACSLAVARCPLDGAIRRQALQHLAAQSAFYGGAARWLGDYRREPDRDHLIYGETAWSIRAGLVALLVISALPYSISALRSISGQISKVCIAALMVFLTLTGAAFMVGRIAPTPAFVITWMVTAMAMLVLIRVAAAKVIGALTAAELLVRKTVIVGGGKEAHDVITALNRDGAAQLQILGVFDGRTDERVSESTVGLTRLGTFEDLGNFCRDQGVDLLIVTVPTRAEERLLQILQKLFALQVDIRICA
jgi:FlaA1/EpsC-like NDP-sugar epimerase